MKIRLLKIILDKLNNNNDIKLQMNGKTVTLNHIIENENSITLIGKEENE